MMDWLDQKQRHEVVVQMLTPKHLDSVIGELDGIDLSNSSVSASYNTDTRTSAKLRVVGEGYVRGAWLRIIIRYPDAGYERELGTYVVAGEPYKLNNHVYDYDLQSLFWAYSQDECSWPLTVGAGAWAMAAAEYECGSFATDFSGGGDVKLTDAVSYESGTNRLKRLYDLCAMAGNRPEINGHGVFTVEREDVTRTPEYTIDINDARGISHGDIQRESDFLTRPNLAGVSYSWSDDSGEHHIYAHADATGDISPDVRGYAVTELHVEEEMNPPTQAHAYELARKYLGEFRETVSWKLSCRYLPIWEGDWVYLDVGDKDPVYSGVRTCMVEDIDIDLLHLDMNLTLKEYL